MVPDGQVDESHARHWFPSHPHGEVGVNAYPAVHPLAAVQGPHVFFNGARKHLQHKKNVFFTDHSNSSFPVDGCIWVKDYYITGRANLISCAVGLR